MGVGSFFIICEDDYFFRLWTIKTVNYIKKFEPDF